jgi:preprotein translocase subunit SecG
MIKMKKIQMIIVAAIVVILILIGAVLLKPKSAAPTAPVTKTDTVTAILKDTTKAAVVVEKPAAEVKKEIKK